MIIERDYVVGIMAAILRASPNVNPTNGAPASIKACVAEAAEILDQAENLPDPDDEDEDDFDEDETDED